MKLRILTGLLGLLLISYGVAHSEEPAKVICTVINPEGRPEVFDVHVLEESREGKRVNRFVSEHSSRKSALKACDQIMSAQEKRWKQQSKGKSK